MKITIDLNRPEQKIVKAARKAVAFAARISIADICVLARLLLTRTMVKPRSKRMLRSIIRKIRAL